MVGIDERSHRINHSPTEAPTFGTTPVQKRWGGWNVHERTRPSNTSSSLREAPCIHSQHACASHDMRPNPRETLNTPSQTRLPKTTRRFRSRSNGYHTDTTAPTHHEGSQPHHPHGQRLSELLQAAPRSHQRRYQQPPLVKPRTIAPSPW